MKFFTGALAAGLIKLSSAEIFGASDTEARCKYAPKSVESPRFDVHRSGVHPRGPKAYPEPVASGSPVSYRISGVAESEAPFINVGDVTLHVQATASSRLVKGPAPVASSTEFELDLCADVVGVSCPLAVGDEFSGVVTWNVFVLRDDVNIAHEDVEITIVQPEGPACGQQFVSQIMIEKNPGEATGNLLDNHLSELVDEGGTTWSKGYSTRFENFSWEDARRISGGTVMRGHLGFEELPRRKYAKAIPSFTGASAGGPTVSALRNLAATTDPLGDGIPVNFDGREAFPDCASVIGRVRDQRDRKSVV